MQLCQRRYNVFSIFLVIPTGFLRALSSKQVQLDEDADSDDDSDAGDVPAQDQQQQPQEQGPAKVSRVTDAVPAFHPFLCDFNAEFLPGAVLPDHYQHVRSKAEEGQGRGINKVWCAISPATTTQLVRQTPAWAQPVHLVYFRLINL